MTAVPPRPAAPDATAGDGLLSVVTDLIDAGHGLGIDPCITEKAALAEALSRARLALPALRDVLAAAEKVRRVEALAEELKYHGGTIRPAYVIERLRRALDGTM